MPSAAAILMTAFFTFAVVFIVGFIRIRSAPPTVFSGSEAAPAPVPRASLGLHIEPLQDRLLLTWNRDAEAIRNAPSAVLRITDGSNRRDVELDRGQLENGSVLYRSRADDVTFRLEVPSEGKLLAESVRVLDANAAAAAVVHRPLVIEAANPAPRAAAAPIVPAMRPFKAAEIDSSKLVRRVDTRLPPAPNVQAELTIPAPGFALPTELPSLPSAVSAHPASADLTAAAYVPPHPVRKVTPTANRPFGISAPLEVSVMVHIDKSGRVQSESLTGRRANPLLAQEALSSAKRWEFAPAQLHGRATEADYTIVFRFEPRGVAQ